MSDKNPQHSHDDDLPRFEPWLGVMASSLIPLVIALYLHSRYFIPAVAVAVALFLAALVMLRRQTVHRRREDKKRSFALEAS